MTKDSARAQNRHPVRIEPNRFILNRGDGGFGAWFGTLVSMEARNLPGGRSGARLTTVPSGAAKKVGAALKSCSPTERSGVRTCLRPRSCGTTIIDPTIRAAQASRTAQAGRVDLYLVHTHAFGPGDDQDRDPNGAIVTTMESLEETWTAMKPCR
jgi:hypothetical protein